MVAEEKTLSRGVSEKLSDRLFPTFKRAGRAAGRRVAKVASYDVGAAAIRAASRVRDARAAGLGLAAGAAGLVASRLSGGGLAIFLSILLWFIDFAYFPFNGLNVASFWNRIIYFGPSDYYGIFFSSGVLVVLVAIAFLKIRHHEDIDVFVSYAFVVWFYALVLSFSGWDGRVLVHLVFGLIFYFVLLRPNIQDEKKANITFLGVLFFDFFFFSLISTINLPGGGGIWNNRILVPVWFLFSLYIKHTYDPSLLSKSLVLSVIVFFLFVNYQEFKTIGSYVQPATQADILEAKMTVATFWENIKQAGRDIQVALNRTVQGQLRYATTGDYYTGQVDENSNERLGVFIEKAPTQRADFPEGEPVFVIGKLTAQTIDKPTQISLSCFSDLNDEKKKSEGVASPDYFPATIINLIIDKKEQESIECRFDEGLETGSHMVTMGADFSFTTFSYLKTFFTEKGNPLVSSKDSSLLRDAGFYGANPIAKYTPGPVGIGIETVIDQPIGIGSQDQEFVLGATIENDWQGVISSIHDIVLYIPEGIDVKKGSCPQFEKFEDIPEDQMQEGFYAVHFTKLEKDKMRNLGKESIKSHISYNCRMFIPKRNAQRLLENNPVAIKYFKITSLYNYHLEENVPIIVHIPGGFYVQMSPKKPQSSGDIKCVGKSGSESLKTATYIFAKMVGDQEVPISGEEKSVVCSENGCEAILKAAYISKGDIIRCTMKAATRSNEEKVDLKEVTIINSKPKVEKVYFNPEKVVGGQTFSCVAEITDPDLDAAVSATYRFEGIDELADIVACERNKEVYRCEKQLETAAEEGKAVVCSVTPYDGEESGDPVSGTTIVLKADAQQEEAAESV